MEALPGPDQGSALPVALMKAGLRLLGGSDLADALADLSGLGKRRVRQLVNGAVDALHGEPGEIRRVADDDREAAETLVTDLFVSAARGTASQRREVPVAALAGPEALIDHLQTRAGINVVARTHGWSEDGLAYYRGLLKTVAGFTVSWYHDDSAASHHATTAAVGQILRDTTFLRASVHRIENLHHGEIATSLPGQTPSHRQPPAYHATVREISRRSSPLVGRERELQEIAAFATGPTGYRWLVGGAWAGKTALLVHLAIADQPESVDVVSYFLSRRAAEADSSQFLANVVPQLAYLCERDSPAATAHEFSALWLQASERAARCKRHLLLIVDGLDEDVRPSGIPSVAALLPATVETWAHVLVSSRPFPELPVDTPDRHPLRHTNSTPLQPFPGARELKALALQELDDMLQRDDDLTFELLGLLTAAAGPLSVEDLAELTGQPGSSTHRRHMRRCLNRAARSLELVGSTGRPRRYQFAHEILLAHAQAHEDLCDPEYRIRLHLWAEKWRGDGWLIAELDNQSIPLYLLDTYPATLTTDPDRLAELVGDVGWVEVAIQVVGVDRVLADLRKAVSAVPDDAELASVLTAVIHQAVNLQHPSPTDQPEYVLRQLALQAVELGFTELADVLRHRLRRRSLASPSPSWTTKRPQQAFTAPLGTRIGRVEALALLPDGRVVSGGWNGQLRLWDPARPGASVELGALDDPVFALAALPDGRVVSGGWDGQLRLWDPRAPCDSVKFGAPPGSQGLLNAVLALAALPDGRVVGGNMEGQVWLWDLAEGGRSVELGAHDLSVHALVALPDGRVVSGASDGRLLLWDLTMVALPVELGTHLEKVYAVAALPDGRVASGAADGQLRLWDPVKPGLPVELGHHSDEVYAVTALPDGRLVSGGSDNFLRLWNPARPGSPVELGVPDGSVYSVLALPDGRVVTGGDDGDGLVGLWDPARADDGARGVTSSHKVDALVVLPDGRAVCGGWDGRLRLWDPARPYVPLDLGAHGDAVFALAALPDGRVVSSGWGGQLRLWNPARPGPPVELGAHGDAVFTLAVLPDGRVASGAMDNGLKLWNPDEPGLAAEIGAPRGEVQALACLTDGRLVSGTKDGVLQLWNPDAPGDPFELGATSAEVHALAALPDGRVLSGSADGLVQLWHLDQPGTSVRIAAHGSPVISLALLPDGRLASGSHERLIVRDLEGGRQFDISCSIEAIAANTNGSGTPAFVVLDPGGGVSAWSCS